MKRLKVYIETEGDWFYGLFDIKSLHPAESEPCHMLLAPRFPDVRGNPTELTGHIYGQSKSIAEAREENEIQATLDGKY
jgi:hypothetical protein